jgi:hypothetical protein
MQFRLHLTLGLCNVKSNTAEKKAAKSLTAQPFTGEMQEGLMAATTTAALEKTTMRKVFWRIIP